MKKIAALLGILAMILSARALADSTTGNLTSGGTIQTQDLIPIARPTQPGTNLKVTVGPIAPLNIGAGLASSGASLILNTAYTNSWSVLQTFLSGDLTAADPIFTGGSIQLPSGTTGQRPGSGVNGMVRYNSDTAALEAYVDGAWGPLTPETPSSGDAGALQIAGSTPGTFGQYSGLTCASHKWLNAFDANGSSSADCVRPDFTDLSGSLSTSQMPAGTGDISWSAGTTSTLLATVNSSPGSYGDTSHVATYTVNGKGLVTASANATITPAAIGAPTDSGTGATGTWGIGISGNAATSTAFAAAPSGCSAGQFVTAISANGTPTCGGISGSAGGDLGGTYPNPTVLNVGHVTSGLLSQTNGGTGHISVASYGALGIASDDCPDIQLAINAGETQPGSVIDFNSLTYNCQTGLTYDPSLVGINLNGAILNAGSMTVGPLWTVTQNAGATSPPIGLNQNSKNVMEDGCFIGPGSSSSVDLFVFNTNNGHTSTQSSRYNFRNLCGVGFRYGEVYQNGAYLIDASDVEYGAMTICFQMPTGFSNSGEGIRHTGGGCFDSTTGVYSDQNSGTNTQNFDHFSFDFDGQVIDDEEGLVSFDTVHVEAQGASLTQPLFKVANVTGTNLRWHGGEFFLDSAGGAGPYSGTSALFDVEGTATSGGGMTVDNVFVHNLGLTSNTLCTGNGRFVMSGSISYDSETANSILCPLSNTFTNAMADGGFEGSSIADNIAITGDTQAITSRFTGTNISIAIDTSGANCAAHSGSHALAVHKIGAAGTAAAFSIFAPIPPNANAIQNLWYSAPGTPTGSFTIQNYFLNLNGTDANGLPSPGKETAISGLQTVTLSGTALAYTDYSKAMATNHIAPASANYEEIKFNLTSAPTGYYCVDDVILSFM